MVPSPSHHIRGTPTVRGGARSDVADVEALTFLKTEVAPAVRRAGAAPLARALGSILRSGDPGLLSSLSERQRRELLETIEETLTVRRGNPPTPRALVRLTSMIALPPPAGAALVRRSSAPAR